MIKIYRDILISDFGISGCILKLIQDKSWLNQLY
jgi:hypothetical protein